MIAVKLNRFIYCLAIIQINYLLLEVEDHCMFIIDKHQSVLLFHSLFYLFRH